MPVYTLTHGDYDGATHYHFRAPEGTTHEDFKNLCDGLMREAAESALRGDTKNLIWPRHSFIGFTYLMAEVATLLENYGYQRLCFEEVIYLHNSIISDHDDDNEFLGRDLVERVVAENQKRGNPAQRRSQP